MQFRQLIFPAICRQILGLLLQIRIKDKYGFQILKKMNDLTFNTLKIYFSINELLKYTSIKRKIIHSLLIFH